MQWKDITSYSRGDKERKPTTFEARAGGLRIVVVYGHIDYRQQWTLWCKPFYDNYPLEGVTTAEDAQFEARQLVRAKIYEVVEALDG